MHICVVGWYFYKEFLDALIEVKARYDIMFVSHRKGEVPFDNRLIPNVGLEWGCYSYYLDNFWDGEGDVLFTHDDVKVFDPTVFDEIASIPYDFSMIFRDKREGLLNLWYHGRAFFAKAKFLDFLKAHGGIWYDKDNHGFNSVEDLSKNKWLNNGTTRMMQQIEWIRNQGTSLKIAPSFIERYLYGFRGKIGLDGLYAELENQVFATQPAEKHYRI